VRQFPANIDVIQYLTVSINLETTFDFGDLTLARRAASCLSDSTRGVYVLGGSNAPGAGNWMIL
jgi:hypothetical protein